MPNTNQLYNNDYIPDSFGLSDNQNCNSTRYITDSISEDSDIKITENSDLTIDHNDSISENNSDLITNKNQNSNLKIDSCDSITTENSHLITNDNQYTEIEKIKLQPNIDNISHIKLKSNITALTFFPYLLVILTLTLTLSILISKIINRRNLKDIIYHYTNKF